ncbi:subtilase-type protease inhibitor [Streptomyces sp. NBC_00879]|uniref:subtilase-type protease inhibitor n=1 Tax=unclassified Streptomyces TaxID=2593676 RepID=UPI00386513FD|nr:subtilase-type protease inhibitor [Streptomyces sp. NBC_00885]WSY76326.1 subtilase-type protease inhibitor [Streptomyces sp. NBC_00879]
MRYIRNTVAAVATASALVLTGTAATGAAQAAQPTQPTQQPAQAKSLYAPSALVLTIGMGETAETATVSRAVTLTCAPRPDGTHPAAAAACTELFIVDGQFSALGEKTSHKMCTRQWNPVVISAQGVWQGKRVDWSAMYGNPCEMEGSMGDGSVFNF